MFLRLHVVINICFSTIMNRELLITNNTWSLRRIRLIFFLKSLILSVCQAFSVENTFFQSFSFGSRTDDVGQFSIPINSSSLTSSLSNFSTLVLLLIILINNVH